MYYVLYTAAFRYVSTFFGFDHGSRFAGGRSPVRNMDFSISNHQLWIPVAFVGLAAEAGATDAPEMANAAVTCAVSSLCLHSI